MTQSCCPLLHDLPGLVLATDPGVCVPVCVLLVSPLRSCSRQTPKTPQLRPSPDSASPLLADLPFLGKELKKMTSYSSRKCPSCQVQILTLPCSFLWLHFPKSTGKNYRKYSSLPVVLRVIWNVLKHLVLTRTKTVYAKPRSSFSSMSL